MGKKHLLTKNSLPVNEFWFLLDFSRAYTQQESDILAALNVEYISDQNFNLIGIRLGDNLLKKIDIMQGQYAYFSWGSSFDYAVRDGSVLVKAITKKDFEERCYIVEEVYE